eukprot:355679-Chlamydomonas_euryale.AAC.4
MSRNARAQATRPHVAAARVTAITLCRIGGEHTHALRAHHPICCGNVYGLLPPVARQAFLTCPRRAGLRDYVCVRARRGDVRVLTALEARSCAASASAAAAAARGSAA